METKICIQCGKELPLDSFAKHRLSKDGHMTHCDSCREESRKLSPLGGVSWLLSPSMEATPTLHPSHLVS